MFLRITRWAATGYGSYGRYPVAVSKPAIFVLQQRKKGKKSEEAV